MPTNPDTAAANRSSSPAISPDNELAKLGTQLLERRSESRYPTRDVVEVQILENDGLCRIAATILDVSRSGLRIEVRSPIAKGSHVEIVLGRALVVFGAVRYCRRSGAAVYAGSLIQQVARAAPLAHAPPHD